MQIERLRPRRPSVQFVYRLNGKHMRRLQRTCNSDFSSEQCFHQANIHQYVRVRACFVREKKHLLAIYDPSNHDSVLFAL